MSRRNLSLTSAVADGNTEAVRALLAEGADANGTTSGGQTPLIIAIVFRHTHILRMLLAAGADPQLRDSLGLNAIDWAERKGFGEGLTLIAQSQSAKQSDATPITHNSDATVSSQSPPLNVENSPATTIPEKLTRSEEKTRQWLAGLKQRFDEEADRKANRAQQATTTQTEAPLVPVNDRPVTTWTTPPEPPVLTETVLIASSPESPTNFAADTSPPKTEIISHETSAAETITPAVDHERKPDPPVVVAPWSTSSHHKRCPKCNRVYNSELVAYCAVDMTPLVSADLPVATARPATATAPLVWILMASTVVAAAATTYLITNYLSGVERTSAPSTAPTMQAAAVKPEMPVAGGELAGKALTLPGAEYPQTAKSEGVGGQIVVLVKVDKKGRVISARSFEGDWRLRAGAIKAATKATFSAEKLGGHEAAGTIVYTFKP